MQTDANGNTAAGVKTLNLSQVFKNRGVAGDRVNKLKGHEAFLKALEFNGNTIRVNLTTTDEPVMGRVKHSDKFTISVQRDNTTDIMLIFKHSIESIEAPAAPGTSRREGSGVQ